MQNDYPIVYLLFFVILPTCFPDKAYLLKRQKECSNTAKLDRSKLTTKNKDFSFQMVWPKSQNTSRS